MRGAGSWATGGRHRRLQVSVDVPLKSFSRIEGHYAAIHDTLEWPVLQHT